MAVFQEATGADFKDTNINIVQSQHIIILVSNTGGSRGENGLKLEEEMGRQSYQYDYSISAGSILFQV